MNNEFDLDQQLANDCYQVGSFDLCRLLLAKDANYPWFILVPQINDISEIFELSNLHQEQMLKEISLLSSILKNKLHADKINIAALGNQISQLHIHVIARYKTDKAFPYPIWGKHLAVSYTSEQLSKLKQIIVPELNKTGVFYAN